jgi:phosphoglucosamine mutase
MTNLGVELALQQFGVALYRAQVGDRYVLQLMEQQGLILGGEGSGHIICLDRTSTGDGIISALQVLAALVDSGGKLAELVQGLQQFPQRLVNVPVAVRGDPSECPAVRDALQQAERQLAGRGRVLLRPSGTEPLIRVMVEGEDSRQVAELASSLAEVVGSAMR